MARRGQWDEPGLLRFFLLRMHFVNRVLCSLWADRACSKLCEQDVPNATRGVARPVTDTTGDLPFKEDSDAYGGGEHRHCHLPPIHRC